MAAEENDLRATLESAFDEHESETGRPTEDAEKPVRTEAEAPAPDTESGEDRGDGRRVDGKFARKAAQEPAGKPAAAPAAVPADAARTAQAPVDQFAKAPQSWKPGAREAWGQLPPDVRAEVYRREKEASTVMQQSAQARQVQEHIGHLQQQFAPALQAEGVDVLTATQNLMTLASRLRFGTPIEKAQLAAQIINSYGVDVNQLANVLDGQPQQQRPQQGMYQDPRVDQLLQELNGMRQQRQEAVQQKAVGEVETFGDGKEFFADVREDMADLLEVAARRKVDLSLEQAYERACALNPEIAKVIEGRRKAESAGTARQSTQRARAAASSIKGIPASGVSTGEPNDLRGAIEAAIDAADGR